MIRTYVSQIKIVAAKELTELFRDWRTVLISVAVPLLLFPLLVSLAVGGSAGSSGSPKGRATVAVAGEDSVAAVEFLQTLDLFTFVATRDIGTAETGVAAGDYSVAIHFHDSGTAAGITRAILIFNNTEPRSAEVANAVSAALERYSTTLAIKTLQEYGLDPKLLTPLVVERHPLSAGARAAGTLALSILVPILTLLAAAVSPIAAAADLGAGEKERGTLEPLFGTCASRTAVIIGKFVAVTVMALIGVTAFYLGTALAYIAGPMLHDGMRLEFFLRLDSIALIVLLAGLTAAVFSAVELTISLCARSARAAQALFLPVLILASAAGYGAVSIVNAPNWYAHLPLINLGLALRAAASGTSFRPGVVAVWAVIYVAAALYTASVVVRGEEVLRQR